MPLSMDLGPINELSLCEEDAAAAGGAVCDGRRYSRSRSDCSTTSSTSCPPNEAKYPKGLHRRLSLPVAATESDDCNYTNQARDSAKDCTTSPSDKGKTEPYESWKQYPVWYLASRAVHGILEQAYKGTTLLQTRTKRGIPLEEAQVEVLAAAIEPAMELLLKQGAFVQQELLKDLAVVSPDGCEGGLGKCTSILQNCLEAMEKLKVAMVAQLNAEGTAKTQYGRVRTLRMAMCDFHRIFRVIKVAELLVLQSQKRPAIANKKLQEFRKSLDAEKRALLIGWLPTLQDARTWSLKAGNSIWAAVSSVPRQWTSFQNKIYLPLLQLASPLGLDLSRDASFDESSRSSTTERPLETNLAVIGRSARQPPGATRYHILAAWQKCKRTTVSLVPIKLRLRRASENDVSPRAISVVSVSGGSSHVASRRFTLN